MSSMKEYVEPAAQKAEDLYPYFSCQFWEKRKMHVEDESEIVVIDYLDKRQ